LTSNLPGIERAKAEIAQAQAAKQAQAEGLRPAVPAEDLASLERQSKAAGIKESLKQAPAIDANNPLPALADQAGAQAVQPRVGEEHPALDAQADAVPKPEPVTVYRGGKPGDPEARFYSESKDYADNYAGRNGRVLQSEKIAPKNALDLTRPADAAVVADAFEQAGLPRPSEQKLGDGVGLAAIPPEVEAILAAKGHDWIRTGNDVEFGKETGRFWIKLKREVAAEHPSPSPNHEVIGIDADTNLPVLKRKGLEQGVTTDVPRGTIGETSGEAQAKPIASSTPDATQQNATEAQGRALQSKGEVAAKPFPDGTSEASMKQAYGEFLKANPQFDRNLDSVSRNQQLSGLAGENLRFLANNEAKIIERAREIERGQVGSASVVARDNELFQQAKKEPYGSQNKLVTEEKYQAAKKRFTDKATRMNAGLDPTALADLAEIGAYHLEAGARSFAAWSSKMISELGEEVKPHLEKIWQQLNKDKAPETKAVEPPKPPVVKTAAAVPGDVPEANFAGNINLDKLNTPEDVKAELQNVYRLNKDKIEAQRRGTVSNQQLKDLAAEVGTTPEKLGKLSKGTALNAEELLAARQTMVATGERLTLLGMRG
jgi:hypothetical protein